MRDLTKESRNKSRAIQFEMLVNNGYTHTTYKALDFFTKQDGKYFTLKVYAGNAANHTHYVNYQTAEKRNQVIENFKQNFDRRESRKAEEKAAQKLIKQQDEQKAAAGETVQADTKKSSILLKKLLKEKFGITCTVKSSFYSGGCSLDIEYKAGPDAKHLQFIENALEYGRFDSMQDYSYSVPVSGLVVDGFKLETFKHVFIEQELPQNLTLQLCQKIAIFWGLDIPQNFNECVEHNSTVAEKFCGESYTYTNLLHRNFRTRNFCTQDTEKITVLSCHKSEKSNDVYFIYEYNGNTYSTEILPQKPTQPAKPTQTTKTAEIAADTVQLVEYSEKSVAVIGNTKPIKEKLKELVGSFNLRLSCGLGWIFSKTKLQQIQDFLSSLQPLKAANMPEILEAEPTAPTFEEIEILQAPQPAQTTLKNEIEKTIEFFKETDVKIYGKITPETIEAAKVQGVEIAETTNQISPITSTYHEPTQSRYRTIKIVW